MALLKVFISSTCYDLGMVRAELRNFIINLGHEPVMSEYNDILFDPRDHTHESCIKEIPNSDAVIVIIGSRFGGKAIPNAISNVDIEKLKIVSKGTKTLENPESISITQLEILKAIDSNIPIFTFVDSRVLNDHLFYEKNKDKGIIDSIEFPSIEKKETAIYIFEFINFLRFRSKNNSISEFNKISDIEDILKKQWSGLLQRLLYDQRSHKNEDKKIENISEELKDIKSLILSSITSTQAKEVGRGVLKYRRVIEFLKSFQHPNIQTLLNQNIEWATLMKSLDIKDVKLVTVDSAFRPYVILIKNDDSFYECRNPLPVFNRMASEWNTFITLKPEVRAEIISALLENEQHSMLLIKHREQPFELYIKELEDRKSGTSTMTISPLTLTEQAKSLADQEDDSDYSASDNDRT